MPEKRKHPIYLFSALLVTVLNYGHQRKNLMFSGINSSYDLLREDNNPNVFFVVLANLPHTDGVLVPSWQNDVWLHVSDQGMHDPSRH